MISAIIPARGGSKAIPKKNLIPFNGRPLISYTINQARVSNLINETYVSTDNENIADVSLSWGAEVIERPDEISDDTSSTESALLHALNTIENKPDIVVLLQCTSPLRRENDIDNAINLVKEGGYDSALSCCKDHNFFWKQTSNIASPVNYDPEDRKMRQNLDSWYRENGSIYVMKRDILDEQECRLGGDIGIYEMPRELSFEIDTPEDYRIVESIAENVSFYAPPN